MKKLFKSFGKFCLFIVKQTVKTVLGVTVTLVILTLIISMFIASYTKKDITLEKNTFLKLDFSADLSEKSNETILDLRSNTRFYPTLEAIKKAGKDPKISGIYLNLDSTNLTMNHLEEVGEALENFKKTGKKIYAFSRDFNNASYLLGTHANEIAMPPIKSAEINITGYHGEFNYFKNLTEFLGIKFNVIHIGDYKAYGESYSKKHMSEEFKSDIKRVNDIVYDYRVNEISANRNIEKNILNRYILEGKLVKISPLLGKKLGLIDTLEYKEDFEEKYSLNKTISLDDYISILDKNKKNEDQNKIAIIYASGEITYNNSEPEKITIETMKKEMEKANKDKDIKGIVLRVNSPGGSALASEIIHHQLSKIKKPIYVSMGGTAASGGYYISSGANKIFATKSTLTGSIGVVSVIPNFTGLIEKAKINVEVVEKGKYAGINSITTPMTNEEIEKIRDSSLEVYDEFKNRVSEGRKIPLDKLEKIAGGRVWLGEEGKKNGLVDEIGGLETTIQALATNLKLKNYQVVEIMEKKSAFDTLLGVKSTYIKMEDFMNSPLKESVNFEIKTPLLLMPYKWN